MKLRNRGINGSWRNGARRTLFGAVNLLLFIGLTLFWLYVTYRHITGNVSFNGFRAVSIVFIGTVFAFIIDDANIRYFFAWLADDEEIAY